MKLRTLCLAFALALAAVTALTGTTNASGQSLAVTNGGTVTSSMGDFRSYRIGDRLAFTITFDGNVQVSGTPRLVVHLDSGDVYADYDPNGHGSTWVQFLYPVAPGDVSDGITVDNAVEQSL